MHIQFWGVRGSIATPGPHTVELGGNTACIEMHTAENDLIILDAGTGIRLLGRHLRQPDVPRISGTLLISHTHWDHIQGFPFFAPLVGPQSQDNHFVIVGQKRVGQQLEKVLAGQFIEPYLPFGYHELTANLDVKEMEGGQSIPIGTNTTVFMEELEHPGGCLGFRIENNGSTVAYCTDSGHPNKELTPTVLKLAANADLLIHDAHFSLEQRAKFPDWGHSSWLEAAQVALEANVGCLVLFHYDPDASDSYMKEILVKTREIFPRTILAREGLSIELPFDPTLWKDQ